MASTSATAKPINLALQGGGSHGAFTWGVLDRILEDERLVVEAIGGTSAGAMNAVVAASGLIEDGRDGARRHLAAFWTAVAEAGRSSPLKRSPIDVWMGNWSLDNSPVYILFDLMSRLTSPYDFNPFDLNPLRDLVERQVDFARLRETPGVDLYLSATNVKTGHVRVFQRAEVTADVVMASACLPHLFHAVEIGDHAYWDGGYMGNPSLFPFFHRSESADIVIVQINPIVREEVPRTAREILDRLNEITFNSSLLGEMRAIEFVHRLLEDGHLAEGRYRQILIHMIESRKTLRSLGASSKLNTEMDFLRYLFETGRRVADRWLAEHFDDIGVRGTVDLKAVVSGPRS
ncbi:MAG: patatin-like phospholipase family protein [Alphaproteobacteria bacterium]|nr:patatin-like phospholipase family protein [Alphaproteobacteria bacterium]MCB9928970.1 patatin-like phospholipase family protein [Alphaproteobacteria bacterium]